MKNVLFCVNKKLPVQDYRVRYMLTSNSCRVWFAMPGKTETIPNDRFNQFSIGEGVAWRDIVEFLRLFRFLMRRRKDFAAVHYFSTKYVLLGPLLARMAGIPSVVTITGFGRVFNSERPVFRILRAAYYSFAAVSLRFPRLILFQNRGDMDFLARRFPSYSPRFKCIGSAVEFAPIVRDGGGTGILTVLCVSRLHDTKGIPDFLEVARRMKGRGIRFCLVGPKSKGDGGLHGRVQDAHRAGTIHYEGELHGSDLRAAYESAQATFFPSYGEGMPRAMIEAGMAGLCPIAYDINANRDLIPNEDAGFLVEKGSIDQVVSILERLLRDRELLHTKAREYQRRMLKHYSMDTYRFRMDECMDDVFRATADANGTAKDVR